MKVALIISTYNRLDALEIVIHSVISQTHQPNEIIIADDGSTNETREIINTFKTKYNLNIIHSWQKDKGFRLSKSRNKAIAKVSSDLIILIDGDVILDKDFVKDHVNFSKKGFFSSGSRVLLNKNATDDAINNKKLCFNIFSRGISNRKNMIRNSIASFISSIPNKSIKGIRGCNISFFYEDYLKVNGFNNDFEGWGREDTEFVIRLFNIGIKRRNLRFGGIQYHLWHGNESDDRLMCNDKILMRTIQEKLSWCQNGVDKFLK